MCWADLFLKAALIKMFAIVVVAASEDTDVMPTVLSFGNVKT